MFTPTPFSIILQQMQVMLEIAEYGILTELQRKEVAYLKLSFAILARSPEARLSRIICPQDELADLACHLQELRFGHCSEQYEKIMKSFCRKDPDTKALLFGEPKFEESKVEEEEEENHITIT